MEVPPVNFHLPEVETGLGQTGRLVNPLQPYILMAPHLGCAFPKGVSLLRGGLLQVEWEAQGGHPRPDVVLTGAQL